MVLVFAIKRISVMWFGGNSFSSDAADAQSQNMIA
jgi:hypothetical protein